MATTRKIARLLQGLPSMGVLCLLSLLLATSLGCNEPAEQTILPNPIDDLPPEKMSLTAYHPAEFLTTEPMSAPLLSQDNHPHGWQQADCTRCHRSPAADQAPTLCMSCHGKNGVGGQVNTCSSCHQVTSTFGAPSTGQHLAHVESGPKDQQCVECHPGQPGNSIVHANGTVNVKFREGGTYDPVSDSDIGNCTISCHEVRAWGGEGCSVCHGNPPSTGLHSIHLAQTDISCRDCHRGNQHDNDKTSGQIEVPGVEYKAITGQCASVCHEETKAWDCTSCHSLPPTSGNHDPDTHSFGCEVCHQDHSHSYKAATEPLDFSEVAVQLASGNYQDVTNDGEANGNCSNTGCHEVRQWGTDCSSCHSYPPTSGSHYLHVVEQKKKCQDCHQGNQHDFDRTSGAIELGGIQYNALSGGCLSDCHEPKRWDCVSCHGFPPATDNHLAHQQAKLSCSECHANHEHSYRMSINPPDLSVIGVQLKQGGTFEASSRLCSTPCHEPRVWGSSCADCHGNPPSTGLHEKHVASGAKCDTCHKGRQHDLDVTSGLIEVGGVGYNNFTGGCTSACHTGTVQWDCSSCHGYPPASGAHQKHVVDLQLGCHLCHQGHQHTYRAAEPNLQDFGPIKVRFTIRGEWNGDTCSNIGCHADRVWKP